MNFEKNKNDFIDNVDEIIQRKGELTFWEALSEFKNVLRAFEDSVIGSHKNSYLLASKRTWEDFHQIRKEQDERLHNDYGIFDK